MENKDNEANTILRDLDSAMVAIKAVLLGIDPRLDKPEMLTTIINTATRLYQRSENKISKLGIKKALASLDDAREDLKASKLLYEAEIYSRSVYSVQQSVEKACKALGLALGIIKRQKSIGHTSPEVFIRMLEEEFSMNFLLPMLEQYTNEDQKGKIEKAKELLSLAESNSFVLKNFLVLKEKQLQSYLLIIEVMRGQGAQRLKAELTKIQESLNTFLPQFELKNDLIVDSIICITSLFILAVITFPHTETSRYSDTQVIHPKNYTKDMPLVKLLPRLQGVTEDTLQSLGTYIENVRPQGKQT